MSRAAVLTGLGTALPARVVTNDMLAERLDTSDEWIFGRTGIRQRYVVDQGMATSDLAVEAGARALRSAAATGVEGVDLVVLATTTPDHPCPATAPDVAARLGLGTVPAFDIAAVCSGFVYALAVASSAVVSGLAERALVIGAETFSSILNPVDRSTAAIFGDGAGAVVLRAGTAGEAGALLGFDLGAEGALSSLIKVEAGGSRQRASGAAPAPGSEYFTMEGKQVFVNAVRRMAASVHSVLSATDWAAADVDWLVGHQANIRILNAVADQLAIPRTKAVVHLDRVGNTSAASIPLALGDAAVRGILEPGQRLALTAFGGGVTWGSATLTWPDLPAVLTAA